MQAAIEEREPGFNSPRLTGEAYDVWGLDLEANVKPRTATLYKKGLALLFDRMDTNTQTFYDEYVTVLGDEIKTKMLNNKVKFMLKELYKEYSSSHTLQSYKGFLSFMRANFGSKFDSEGFNKFRTKQLKDKVQHIKKIRKKEIRVLIETAEKTGRTEISKLRGVALIHVLKDSGLSRSDIARLDVGDVLPYIEAKAEFCQIPSFREKTSNEQMPHLGPETLEALLPYLEERRNPTQTVRGRRREPEVFNDESPLFIYTQKTRKHDYGERLTRDEITNIIKKLSQKSNLKESFTPHSFRSYNWTRLEAARMPKNWLCLLQGRAINDSSEAYTIDLGDPDDLEKLMETYKDSYYEIAVNEMPPAEEVEALRARVAELEGTLENRLMEIEAFMRRQRGLKAERREEVTR